MKSLAFKLACIVVVASSPLLSNAAVVDIRQYHLGEADPGRYPLRPATRSQSTVLPESMPTRSG